MPILPGQPPADTIGVSIAPDGTISADTTVYLIPPAIPSDASNLIAGANGGATVIGPADVPSDIADGFAQLLGYATGQLHPLVGAPLVSIGGGIPPSGGKILPIDRWLATGTDNYQSGDLAPHAPTTRMIRAVPTGHLYCIQSAIAQIWRVSPAAPAGVFTGHLYVLPNGGVTAGSLRYIRSAGNAVEDPAMTQWGDGWIFLQAGDELHFQTDDASTGGLCDYMASWQFLDFV